MKYIQAWKAGADNSWLKIPVGEECYIRTRYIECIIIRDKLKKQKVIFSISWFLRVQVRPKYAPGYTEGSYYDAKEIARRADVSISTVSRIINSMDDSFASKE